jgi:hypothetical protein
MVVHDSNDKPKSLITLYNNGNRSPEVMEAYRKYNREYKRARHGWNPAAIKPKSVVSLYREGVRSPDVVEAYREWHREYMRARSRKG